MPCSLEEIASELNALTAADFDYSNSAAQGLERLHALCEELRELEDGPSIAPVIFRTIERLDGADLGSPGSLVHTLESWRGKYEHLLADSIRRKPLPLTVWMVNRILNSDPSDVATWLSLLHTVERHPMASSTARADAKRCLQFQAARRTQ